MLDKYTKILSDSTSEKAFRTPFGEIKNLAALRDALLEKGDTFYSQYANSYENHFANWISGVFGDHELSESLKKSNSYEDTVKLLDDRIKYLDLWLSFNAGKEKLHTYLADNYPMKSNEYMPSHLKFETLYEFTEAHPLIRNSALDEGENPLPDPAKVISPLPQHIKPLEPPFKETPKLTVKVAEDKKLLMSLEEQFPGLRVIETPKPKTGFFAKIFGKK